MSDTSYQQRYITVRFVLKAGQTFDGANDTLTITSARCHASADSYLNGTSSLQLSIWGLSRKCLAQLGSFGVVASDANQYAVQVLVGDVVFFTGTIITAYADFSQVPDVPLVLTAQPAMIETTTSTAGFSQAGGVSADTIISSVCSSIGYSFTNNGVSAIITNPHYVSDAIQNMRDIARDGKFRIDIENKAVSIWPDSGARDDVMLEVSAGRGLLGYPSWDICGLALTLLYTPEAKVGRDIQVYTDLPNATGLYTIISARHTISSKLTGGQWITSVECKIKE